METAVEHLVSAIEALPGDATNAEVTAAFAALDRFTAWLSDVVGRLDPAADGAVTTAPWLRVHARRSHREAAALVRRAARLGEGPAVAEAWSHGQLATGQVDAVVAGVNDRRQPVFNSHEGELVPMLARLSVGDTERALRQWAAYADAVVESPAPVAPVRSVYLCAGLDGWGELTGRLDPAGFPVIDAALDAATGSDPDGEPARTGAERRADAMVAIARHFLDHADVASTSRRRRPDVTVVVTVADLEERAGRAVDGEVLDATTVGSLLCDAGVHRIVTDGRSIVLDAGRTMRTVGHHLFTALAVRDGGCRFPGCDRPVSRCEAHHVVAWQHGGSTDQSNLALH